MRFHLVYRTIIINIGFRQFSIKSDQIKQKGLNANKTPPEYELPLSHYDGHNFWIFKAPDLNRGRGIHVFNTIEQLQELIEQY